MCISAQRRGQNTYWLSAEIGTSSSSRLIVVASLRRRFCRLASRPALLLARHAARATDDGCDDKTTALFIKDAISAKLERERAARANAQRVAIRQKLDVVSDLNTCPNKGAGFGFGHRSDALLKLFNCMRANKNAFSLCESHMFFSIASPRTARLVADLLQIENFRHFISWR